ncbi:uncharacterized protein LOC130827830 isoform X2 [Amaranthus tricolor]|uniref:uncharacterized protein LOC130827830 isoform X2 n=1 Tax=Amaranthus tricolor TaxID=29722 RepID=UPI0025842303|nr:uncharacterized protein LOC130827830 isoform X2 [Amaranthus tricolor]
MGDFREQNGVVLEESPSSCSSCSISSFSPEVWAQAEQATHEIIKQVQPTVVSEERRGDVIDYVKRLLKGYLGCEVEEAFANDVFAVLEAEDHNPAAEFVVKDVQYIRAEVKLVKCLVQNIVVDISFNQIGGLCALCFLEEVDRLIGKDHLFKRSIILIKAWCYYESRILGAHHSLISTYALETLVLYIFHLFHSSLGGPLEVLHKFLEYFSKFDWDNFCVSLNGPVHLSSLPEFVVERPESCDGDLLLSDDFMRECVSKFSVPSRGNETNYRTFLRKHLNIVDPLKENNNLGRSVNKGNFFRIRSAFSYGARKLGQILLQPQENIAEEVCNFFTNTLARHGKGQRPDVQDLLPTPGCSGFVPEIFISGPEPSLVDNGHEEASVDFREPTVLDGTEVENHREVNRSHPSRNSPAANDEFPASPTCLSGNAIDHATYGVQDLRLGDHRHNPSPYLEEDRISQFPNLDHDPNINLSRCLENGKMENGDLDHGEPTDSTHSTIRRICRPHTCHDGSNLASEEQENDRLCNHSDSNSCYSSKSVDSHYFQDSHSSGHSSKPAGSYKPVILLHDLSGNVNCNLNSLRYGRLWYDHGLQMTIPPMHVTLSPLFRPKNPWDTIRQSMQFRQDVIPQMNLPRPTFFPLNPPVLHGAFSVDEIPKTRGTGTYFPITNHQSYRDRSYMTKGRSQGQLKSPRTNGRGPIPFDRNPQVRSPGRHGVGRPKSSDSHENSPMGKVYKEVNGFSHNTEKAVEFATLHPPIEDVFREKESCQLLDSVSSPGGQNGESVFVANDDRLSMKSFRLKDDEDFPPLSV